jgi:hypothetical protein
VKRPYAKPQVQTASKCLVDGCERAEELVRGRPAGGLCAAHRRRKKLGQSFDEPIDDRLSRSVHRMSPAELLMVAVVRLGDAEGPEDFRRARATFFKRVWRFVRTVRRRAPSTR